jgi:hypothetical protein
MSGKLHKPQSSSTQNSSTPSNNQTNLIESLFSSDYMVEPTDQTAVLVQGSNDKPISWTTKWDAPNGFSQESKVADKGANLTVPFSFMDAVKEGGIRNGDRIRFTAVAEHGGSKDTETRDFIIQLPTEEVKVWEVFFDNKDQNTDGSGAESVNAPPPRRSDPLVFDLNRDGRLDTTDGTQLGNGEMDGSTVLFDIDPTRESPEKWGFETTDFRPGRGQCPPVPNGFVIYDSGSRENIASNGRWSENRSKGSSAVIYDSNGKKSGYWDGRRYFWGPEGQTRKEEETEWIRGTGDGFLVWDINNNGKIDSNTEMMSEFDVDGNKVFENGFEKLAHYFDKDENGIISGSELDELKFWVDDGDAKTEKGELRELSEFGIRKITIPQKGELESTTTATKEEFTDAGLKKG